MTTVPENDCNDIACKTTFLNDKRYLLYVNLSSWNFTEILFSHITLSGHFYLTIFNFAIFISELASIHFSRLFMFLAQTLMALLQQFSRLQQKNSHVLHWSRNLGPENIVTSTAAAPSTEIITLKAEILQKCILSIYTIHHGFTFIYLCFPLPCNEVIKDKQVLDRDSI